MTPILPFLLIPYGLFWFLYLAGFRDKRFAFALWFPLTATALLGTLLWLFSLVLLLYAFVNGGPNASWYAIGVSEVTISFLPCPILLGLALWKRPPSEAYSVRKVLSVVFAYVALPLAVNSFSIYSDTQKLQVTVEDIKGRPVEHARANYTLTQPYIAFWLPEITKRGDAETGIDGTFIVGIPKSCALDCTITTASYAPLRIQMPTGENPIRDTLINWYFPAEMKDADDWRGHSGAVKANVHNSEHMTLTVFLPKTSADIIPSYGDARCFPKRKASHFQNGIGTASLVGYK